MILAGLQGRDSKIPLLIHDGLIWKRKDIFLNGPHDSLVRISNRQSGAHLGFYQLDSLRPKTLYYIKILTWKTPFDSCRNHIAYIKLELHIMLCHFYQLLHNCEFCSCMQGTGFINLISSYQATAKQMLSEDEEKKTKSFFTLRALLYVMGSYTGSQITGDKMDAYCKPTTSAREEGARKPTLCDSSRNEL